AMLHRRLVERGPKPEPANRLAVLLLWTLPATASRSREAAEYDLAPRRLRPSTPVPMPRDTGCSVAVAEPPPVVAAPRAAAVAPLVAPSVESVENAARIG